MLCCRSGLHSPGGNASLLEPDLQMGQYCYGATLSNDLLVIDLAMLALQERLTDKLRLDHLCSVNVVEIFGVKLSS